MNLSSIDIATLLPSISLSGGQRERYGPCPICGGTDRFHIKQFDDKQMWFCRNCHPDWGDAIKFLMWIHNIDFRTASGMLALTPTPPLLFPPLQREQIDRPPDAEWQSKASALISELEGNLWDDSTTSNKAIRWLNDRGLSNESIKLHRLGLSKKEGYQCGLLAHKGISIPTISNGDIWQVRTRTPNGLVGSQIPNAKEGTRYSKYMGVAGGKVGLFGFDFTGSVSLLVGGEFDAMIAWQCCQSIKPITFGSESKRIRNPWKSLLPKRILVCYDADDAGIKGMAAIQKDIPEAVLITLPDGKDITEFYLKNKQGCIDWLNELARRENDTGQFN